MNTEKVYRTEDGELFQSLVEAMLHAGVGGKIEIVYVVVEQVSE
jgi:hypothetical protein